MRLDSLRVVAAILGMVCVTMFFMTMAVHPTFAQGNDAKTPEQRAQGYLAVLQALPDLEPARARDYDGLAGRALKQIFKKEER